MYCRCSTSPSDTSTFSASRSGVLDTSKVSQKARSSMRAPGGSSPSSIMVRSRAAISADMPSVRRRAEGESVCVTDVTKMGKCTTARLPHPEIVYPQHRKINNLHAL
ncbi:protein of unknown function [Cupriavidus taiwanensis]|nr:protein of unknown function [Cupriavidus taiwanensis]